MDKLILNQDKTVFLLIWNDRQWSKYLSDSFELFVSKLTAQNLLGILGAIFDKYFTFCSQIPADRSSQFYHFRHLQHIHHYLGFDSARLLALLAIGLNFCNSLWSGIADTDLTGLQHAQNCLTHIMTKFPPFACSVSLLPSLHWLPVQCRILLNISFMIYKKLHEKQPVYLL